MIDLASYNAVKCRSRAAKKNIMDSAIQNLELYAAKSILE